MYNVYVCVPGACANRYCLLLLMPLMQFASLMLINECTCVLVITVLRVASSHQLVVYQCVM